MRSGSSRRSPGDVDDEVVGGGVDEARLDRLVEHVETVVDGLVHESDPIPADD